ncbi:MAG: hypothetical protein HY720_18200, partial [Planctomycetes bacterium]|nr:hypothetical protein [Planctomycetota bacterium]
LPCTAFAQRTPRPDLAARIERQESILARLGMPPSRIARAVVRAILQNRSRVVVGAGPRALLFLFALVPPFARRFNEIHYRRLLREGIFD